MGSERVVRVMTRAMLARLNRKAIRGGANRSLKIAAVNALPKDRIFPVSSTALHNDTDVRCRIVLDETGRTAELDMTVDDYNTLPSVTIPREDQ